MADTNTFIDYAIESGSKKVGEDIINRALNAVVDFAKKKYGESQVVLGSVFQRYLSNATERYNKVRTLATGTEPRTVIGQNSIYVNIGVFYQNKEISTATVEPLIGVSKNLLILGTGGLGKSMLMRYLFLNTADRGEYIPILLELRKIDKQSSGNISIIDLIYSCLNEFDAELPKEQFEYSLRLGKYLFLLDGFDEVKDALASETAEAIQAFCAKYPKNPCIITSRPRQNTTSPLETFTVIEAMPLSKEQAVMLASKIWEKDEKTIEFCKQLDESLYEKHKDFAENPLLLSMMFLTFMRNNSIPDHLADFYQKSYDALFSAHDTQNKGYYRRDFRCNSLDEGKFKTLLSHFCFQTYFKEAYEFTYEEIVSYINSSIAKLKYDAVTAQDFIFDLRDVVCIIIKDGEIFRFSHRSFQTYFAAFYSANMLTDEQQKKLFKTILSRDVFYDNNDYYELLYQLQPERFSINALEEGLRKLLRKVEAEADCEIALLKSELNGISVRLTDGKDEQLMFHISSRRDGNYYNFNLINLFRHLFLYNQLPPATFDYDVTVPIKIIIEKQPYDERESFYTRNTLSFEQLDIAAFFTDEDRNTVYETCIKIRQLSEVHSAITEWLSEVDAKRAVLSRPDFIDDL